MAAQRKQAVNAKKTIGIVGYDGVQALDIVGPVDSFSIASAHLASERYDSGPAYEVLVLGPSRRAFVAESGIVIRPHHTLDSAPPLDTVIVAGGQALRLQPATNARIAHWLKARPPRRAILRGASNAPSGLLPDNSWIICGWTKLAAA